jgi:glycosyltransferase involved in cell wall biosynthesis
MPDVSRWTDPDGVPVRIFARGWDSPVRDYLFAAGVVWTLWKERHRYRLVYFLMQGLHLAAGLPMARLLGKAVVMKFSGSGIINTMSQSFLGRLELRWLQRWADRIMILNTGMEKEALAVGFSKAQLCWMPNPVDTNEFAPATPEKRRSLRLQFAVPLDVPVVVYVGRLAPEKELPSLLGAFAKSLRRVPEARLVIVGDGPERERLTRAAEELDLAGRVLFTGRKPAIDVRRWLQLADVFALVSANEGFSCSLVEAMSVELPSLVSAIPANLQLIDSGVHGLLAPIGDEDSLAAALTRLLLDASLRAAMGRAARQRVLDNYSVNKVLDRYEALFREALARHS